MAKHDYHKAVNYDAADPVKILAQKAAAATSGQLEKHGWSAMAASRGESAFLAETATGYIALTQEGLGTKSLITQAVYEQTGESFFRETAIDTVSTIANDLVTVGALPTIINAYWSSSSYDWLEDNKLASDLIYGWQEACELVGATWGGGETQSLKDMVVDGALELAGSGVGLIEPKSRLVLGDDLKAGGRIVFLESTGIQTNGISLAREIAAGLPDGYQTKLPSGQTFGQGLLAASHLYPSVIADLFKQEIPIHYMAHITGHGWRKIMRHTKDLCYVIENVPPVPEVLTFLVEQNEFSAEEAYGTFNMGAGFAIYVPAEHVETVIDTSQKHGIKAYDAGYVTEGERAVEIKPLNLTFSTETLQLR